MKIYGLDDDFRNAKLSLKLLIALIAVMASIMMVNIYTNKVQNDYLRKLVRPTLQQFFDQKEKQKNN